MNHSIQLTVALPCFKAQKIAWLAMEGLCNQQTIDFEWELLVCEERHHEMCGDDFFYKYSQKLLKAGCVKFKYIDLNHWVPLVQKWRIMGQHMSQTSKAFLLQAADCYSPAQRLALTFRHIAGGADWVDFTKGYFYSFPLKKLILYDHESPKTNLNMGMAADHARTIPMSDKPRYIDNFLLNTIKAKKTPQISRISTLLPDSLDTDGQNNISTKRIDYFKNPVQPFRETPETIHSISIPPHIKEKLLTI